MKKISFLGMWFISVSAFGAGYGPIDIEDSLHGPGAVVMPRAQETDQLGENLFSTEFGGGVTGTSQPLELFSHDLFDVSDIEGYEEWFDPFPTSLAQEKGEERLLSAGNEEPLDRWIEEILRETGDSVLDRASMPATPVLSQRRSPTPPVEEEKARETYHPSSDEEESNTEESRGSPAPLKKKEIATSRQPDPIPEEFVEMPADQQEKIRNRIHERIFKLSERLKTRKNLTEEQRIEMREDREEMRDLLESYKSAVQNDPTPEEYAEMPAGQQKKIRDRISQRMRRASSRLNTIDPASERYKAVEKRLKKAERLLASYDAAKAAVSGNGKKKTRAVEEPHDKSQAKEAVTKRRRVSLPKA